MEPEKASTMLMQVCSMRIAFPVESDEQAIEYKKRINEVLSDLSAVRISFDLTTVPQTPRVPNVAL